MLFQLASKGIFVALLAFVIIWSSRDPNKYRKLVWVTLFLTFDVIMFGAFTRLTDSGLGCPDWPGCYGHANPLQALEHIRAAEALMPDGPVTVMKAWIEMIHRYLAMGIGVLIIAIVVIAWRFWLQSGRTLTRFAPHFPMLLLAFVCVQGAFGAWTVTMKLQPVIVTIHLLLGMTLLGMLTWVGARQKDHAPVDSRAYALRIPAAIALTLLALQIALGGWVSTNYAALACMDFPLCDGALMPQMDFDNGFTLWRSLGKTAEGDYLPFSALMAIHWTHRMFAFVVAAYIGWVGWKALRIEGLQPVARAVLAALALQITLGIATVSLKWPLALAVAHNGCAALLVLLLVMLNYKARIPGQTGQNREPDHMDTRSSSASKDNA
ncbi:heme A synthase [Herminiimonas sp.]|uniref:COX15/CtaA family protein n=1 Tax=Herminiimonas sp. TaxID=1926289 RepID=UPI002717F22C|nr:COX15/CtaA family protein [Herminiimonas sp.]MDO8305659.1 COX15/CtaA family protein [Herminiimonas sp.]